MSFNTNDQAVALYTTSLGIDLLLQHVLAGELTIKFLSEKIKDDLYLIEDTLDLISTTKLGEHIRPTKEISSILDTEILENYQRLLLIDNKTGGIVTIIDMLKDNIESEVLPMVAVSKERRPIYNTYDISPGRQQAMMQAPLGGIRNAVTFIQNNPIGPMVMPDGRIMDNGAMMGNCRIFNKYNGTQHKAVLNLHQEIASILNSIPEMVYANGGNGFLENNAIVSRLVGLYFAGFCVPAGTISLSYPVTSYRPDWFQGLVDKIIVVAINGDKLDYIIQ